MNLGSTPSSSAIDLVRLRVLEAEGRNVELHADRDLAAFLDPPRRGVGGELLHLGGLPAAPFVLLVVAAAGRDQRHQRYRDDGEAPPQPVSLDHVSALLSGG
jgi:hypothetical protein